MNEPTESYQIAFRPLAVIRDWNEFRKACRDRCDELRTARTTVDAVGGFPAGQTAKLIAPIPPQGFGTLSFSSILGALGLAMVVVEDAEALARIRHRLLPRNEDQAHFQTTEMLTVARAKKHAKKRAKSRRGDSDWGRLMTARRLLLQSPHKRKRIAQAAARARWRGHRPKGRKSP